MHMTELGLLPPSSYVIRKADYVRSRAIFMKDRPDFAGQKIGWVNEEIFDWDKAGGKILTPQGSDHLVVTPTLRKLDGFVHPSRGGPVFREFPHFKLLDPPCAFHADGKRTLNAFMQKADGEIRNILDKRLISAVFWISAAEAIETHRLSVAKEPFA